MGNLCCCIRKHKKKIVLLLVGLDNAGKTVAARGLAGESTNEVVPTVGFSIVNLRYLDYIVKVFDLGGGPNIRGIWHKYFVDAHGVIFVVDSSDVERLDEARSVLKTLLAHEKISKKPVLVLANKQDNENALDEVDLIEKMDLESIVNGNECPTLVETCCASAANSSKVDDGIKRGYQWLLNYIVRNYETLNTRVEADVTEQTTLENLLRWEKIEKIRAMKSEVKNDDDAIESYSNYERKLLSNGVDNGKNDDDRDSESSGGSFPHMYHIRDNVLLLERPRSAIQVVREQLELNAPHKKSFVSRASNKTSPLQLYNNLSNNRRLKSKSASLRDESRVIHVKSRDLDAERRKLKSAGEAMSSSRQNAKDFSYLHNLPSTVNGDGDELHHEIYSLKNIVKKNSQQSSLRACSSSKAIEIVQHTNGDLNKVANIVELDL